MRDRNTKWSMLKHMLQLDICHVLQSVFLLQAGSR
jgi:hypothetical protein